MIIYVIGRRSDIDQRSRSHWNTFKHTISFLVAVAVMMVLLMVMTMFLFGVLLMQTCPQSRRDRRRPVGLPCNVSPNRYRNDVCEYATWDVCGCMILYLWPESLIRHR